MSPATACYIGRFAPSPTGKLHFGSLVTAVASYLDAKAHNGQWLVRIEDLDPPREEPGAADSILRSLEAHHLFWDQTPVYQSQRLEAYQLALNRLADFVYPCCCTRQRLSKMQGRYDGHCIQNPPTDINGTALRLPIDLLDSNQSNSVENFEDCFLGKQYFPLTNTGDFVLRRKDHLFAYQLAVAVDDAYQGITHVIRGYDLLDSTSRQRYLLALFNKPLPDYGHTPLVLGSDGNKLSKQTKAKPLKNSQAMENLYAALVFLGYAIPKHLGVSNCSELLNWARDHWRREQVPRHSSTFSSLTCDIP